MATDSDGDKVSVFIYLGSTEPGNEAHDAAVQQCGNDLGSVGDSLERALVIPFRVSLRIKSSLSTPLKFNLNNGLHQATSGGNVGPPDQLPYWAMDFSSGPQGQSAGEDGPDAGSISWATASPLGDANGQGWLVLPNAITPNDPTGSESYATRLVMIPTITIGIAPADLTFDDTITESGVVRYSLPDPAAGDTLYLATDRLKARLRGCD